VWVWGTDQWFIALLVLLFLALCYAIYMYMTLKASDNNNLIGFLAWLLITAHTVGTRRPSLGKLKNCLGAYVERKKRKEKKRKENRGFLAAESMRKLVALGAVVRVLE
jgi:hypothetical protein